jgi:hypothetical protein
VLQIDSVGETDRGIARLCVDFLPRLQIRFIADSGGG